jgi:hypothetical protein
MSRRGVSIAGWSVMLVCALVAFGVPSVDAQQLKAKAAGAVAKMDLNAATQAELEKLPGVGAATAKKIIAGRPYASVADLEKAGVGKATVAKIAPLVAVGGAAAGTGTLPAPTATLPAPRSTPAAKAAARPIPETAAPAPPARGMVWVNTETKVYHKEGDVWYGKTKHGMYMSEADALKAGYRASKQ